MLLSSGGSLRTPVFLRFGLPDSGGFFRFRWTRTLSFCEEAVAHLEQLGRSGEPSSLTREERDCWARGLAAFLGLRRTSSNPRCFGGLPPADRHPKEDIGVIWDWFQIYRGLLFTCACTHNEAEECKHGAPMSCRVTRSYGADVLSMW